ncbi:MAG: AI-2E family transporter [Candidatus Sulfotelmatobacter sp.]
MARSSNPTTGTAYPRSFLVIAVGVTIALLYFGREIFIPVALAFVLSFLLTPLVSWFQKLRIGRVPAVLIVMALCLAMTVFVGWKIGSQLVEITTHLTEYRTNIEQKLRALRSHHNTPILQATDTVQQLNQQLTGPSGQSGSKTNGGSRPPISVQVTRPPASFFQELRDLLGPLAGSIETAGLVIIFVTFMLINWEDLRSRLIRLGGQGRLSVVTQAMEEASEGLSRYLLLQFLVNSCYGCIFGTALYFIGVPHALLWGALATSLRFVPYVGVWIACVFPVALSVAVFPGWNHAGYVFAIFVALEIITANAVEPWLYGSHAGITPFAILVAAVFWATLWGPVGLVLSVPLTLCLILVGRYVPQMSFLEVLLGDAPPLKPEENYYQRLLATDPDEATDLAHSYLEGKSLQNVYECLLVPALRLAEEDRHTGVIDDRAADFVAQSTRELIEDLAERYNAEPRSSGVETYLNNPNFAHASIVAIPARDQADELVGMMLAQLLQKAGATNVRALPIDTVENMLTQVERGQFVIACISALPPFAVGQARSLCKRLHGRFPDLTVIVGLWGFAGGVPKAQERIGTACTDAVCTNFSEAFFQIQKLVETNGTGGTKQEQPAENAGATIKAGPRAIAS